MPAAPVHPAVPEEKPVPSAVVQQNFVQSQEQTSSYSPRRGFNPKLIGIVVFLVLFLMAGGAAAYYYVRVAPSSQSVLDAMFKHGFAWVTSEDNTTSISIDVHVVPTSTPAAAGVNAIAGAVLGGTPSEVVAQANASGTIVFVSGSRRDVDENFGASFSTKGTGQSVTFNLAGEVIVVDNVGYINISAMPSLGFFDPTPFEGKWIKLEADSSTESIAQGFAGGRSLAGATTTISAANIQKIMSAIEGMITITKTLPDDTIGGVPSDHYQYDISKTGVESAALTFATIAQESIDPASSTLDASTTDAITSGTENFLSVFTTMGGELWIGKSDDFPHQGSLTLAFATSTPYGSVNGTLNATTTVTNINGSQTIVAPAGAVDFQTLMQAALSSPAGVGGSLGATQSEGRDARRISDLHEIQNGLELYYNKCGRYPGGAAASSDCSAANVRVSTFAGASSAMIGSDIGITSIPNDPSAGAKYYYGTDSTGLRYIIAARLEDVNNLVFSTYKPLSLSGISASGLTSCNAPMYCLSL